MVQWADLGSKATAPILLALLIGGCPKRQTTPRVVYVQASPQASATGTNPAATGSTETLTIEEPPPPPATEPAAKPVPVVTAQPTPAAPRRRPRTDSHEGEGTLAPADTTGPADVPEPPQLEPLSSNSPENETRDLQARQEQMRGQIGDLEKNPGLSESDRRTLRDAEAFLSQSRRALDDHNLLRARELANKASQLLSAVTPGR
ncbi:MAG TPA: hypothetical protein VI455_03950 [Terriglobia bacterium]